MRASYGSGTGSSLVFSATRIGFGCSATMGAATDGRRSASCTRCPCPTDAACPYWLPDRQVVPPSPTGSSATTDAADTSARTKEAAGDEHEPGYVDWPSRRGTVLDTNVAATNITPSAGDEYVSITLAFRAAHVAHLPADTSSVSATSPWATSPGPAQQRTQRTRLPPLARKNGDVGDNGRCGHLDPWRVAGTRSPVPAQPLTPTTAGAESFPTASATTDDDAHRTSPAPALRRTQPIRAPLPEQRLSRGGRRQLLTPTTRPRRVASFGRESGLRGPARHDGRGRHLNRGRSHGHGCRLLRRGIGRRQHDGRRDLLGSHRFDRDARPCRR